MKEKSKNIILKEANINPEFLQNIKEMSDQQLDEMLNRIINEPFINEEKYSPFIASNKRISAMAKLGGLIYAEKDLYIAEKLLNYVDKKDIFPKWQFVETENCNQITKEILNAVLTYGNSGDNNGTITDERALNSACRFLDYTRDYMEEQIKDELYLSDNFAYEQQIETLNQNWFRCKVCLTDAAKIIHMQLQEKDIVESNWMSFKKYAVDTLKKVDFEKLRDLPFNDRYDFKNALTEEDYSKNGKEIWSSENNMLSSTFNMFITELYQPLVDIYFYYNDKDINISNDKIITSFIDSLNNADCHQSFQKVIDEVYTTGQIAVENAYKEFEKERTEQKMEDVNFRKIKSKEKDTSDIAL